MTPTVTPIRTITTAADLQVGDVLADDGRDVVVTGLSPATREESLAAGVREVQSGTWWRTFDATERVTAAPGRRRPSRLAEQAETGELA